MELMCILLQLDLYFVAISTTPNIRYAISTHQIANEKCCLIYLTILCSFKFYITAIKKMHLAKIDFFNIHGFFFG